jgi:hypothetical protein
VAKSREGVELLDDGRSRLVVDSVTFTLRRPKVGELRALYEGLGEVAAAEQAETQTGPAAMFGDSAQLLAGWWGTVMTMLADKPDEFPADADDLPVWLLTPGLITKLTAHWREVPYLSGG